MSVVVCDDDDAMVGLDEESRLGASPSLFAPNLIE